MKTKSLLLELPFEQEFVIKKITELSHTLSRNIVFFVLFPHIKNQHKNWIDEVMYYLYIIDAYMIKPENKKLKRSKYFELLYKDPFEPSPDKLLVLLNIAQKSKKKLSPKVYTDLNDVIDIISSFYDKICSKLTIVNNIDDKYIIKEITKMINRLNRL